MRRFINIFLISLLFLSCESKEKTIVSENLFFGHRGSGANVYDNKYIENTLPSVKLALKHLDGCEVDIQMSSDGTIWLYHDDMLGHFCDSVNKLKNCIPTTSDKKIQNIRQCRSNISDRIYRLDEVLALLSLTEHENKFISLDVKGYFDSLCFTHRNAPDSYFEKMASELILIVDKYDVSDQIILETGYTNFLDKVKSLNPKIRCHLIGYKNFNEVMFKAIEKNYDGVSFSLFDESITSEAVEQAKQNGLEVQVWPINDSILLRKAKKMKPFSMQISKLNFSN